MKVSTNELAVINLLVQVDNDGKARTFPINELQTAMDVFNEMKKLVKEDKFTDWDITFSTEQKTFILKLMEDRKFNVIDAEAVFSLKEKIQ